MTTSSPHQLSQPPAQQGKLEVRPFRLGDVDALCSLLGAAFAAEYAEQGLAITGFRRQYQLVGLANAVLAPLGRDFFKVAVAIWHPDRTVADSDGHRPRLVGTMTSFPADDDGVWYQGFGAVDPTLRRQGVYKRVIRFTLEDIAQRGARIGGGEIRTTNEGALRSYRDNFAAEILPKKALWLWDQRSASSWLTERQVPQPPGMRLSNRNFAALPEAAAISAAFRGGFLIEREARRSFTSAVWRGLLPPITVVTWAQFDPHGRLAALARVRVHWPAHIRAIDAVWLAPDLAQDAAATFLAAVATGRPGPPPKGRPPVRLYADDGDDRLQTLASHLGFRLWCHLHPIRTDVAQALAGTDAAGNRLALAAERPR